MSRSATEARYALPPEFFARAPVPVARALLGRVLVRQERGARLAGRIVEVEAYGGEDDPASHARPGRTARNAAMFGPPGRAYVYFTYGMHHCLNLVTGREGRAAAVLIRALEPLDGLPRMRARRGAGVPDHALLRGPGCVARGLGLDRRHDGLPLAPPGLWVASGAPRRAPWRVVAGPRIGIRLAADRPWRFWLEGHPAVSAPRRGGTPLSPRVSR